MRYVSMTVEQMVDACYLHTANVNFNEQFIIFIEILYNANRVNAGNYRKSFFLVPLSSIIQL